MEDPSPAHELDQQPPSLGRRRLLLGAVALVIVTAAASSAITAAVLRDGGEPTAAAGTESTATPDTTRLERARINCGVLRSTTLGDDGHSLNIDGAGRFDGPSVDDVTCILDELDAPASVDAKIGNTRALDGMVDATWDDFTATWTYHPDDGLNMIIEQRSG